MQTARIFFFLDSKSSTCKRSNRHGKSRLVLLSLLDLGVTEGVRANLLVILLKGSQIFTSLGELTFLHTLTDVPVDEGTLGIHEIELVVKTSPGLGDGGGVGKHAHGTLNLGEVTTRDDGRGLVVDTDLETGRAPVDELNGALGLDGGNSSVGVLGNNITTVQQTAGHVLAVTGVALDHLVVGLEASIGDLRDRELLVVSLGGGDNGSIGDQGEMNTGVRNQVGLELVQVHVEGTIETEGGGDGGDNLGNEPVQVGVGRTLNVKVATANVINGLVINHEGTVGVLQGGVGGQDGVVGLDDSGGDLRSGVDGELKLGLLAVVNGETLQEEGTETGTGTTTEGVEDKEALETSTVVSKLADTVQDGINQLLTDGVVTTGVVVGGIFLTGDQLLRVEQLAVGTSADLIDDGGLKIDEDGTGYVLTSTGLGEESVERVVTSLVLRGDVTIGVDTVLHAVQLPAGVTNLDTGLTDVKGNDFSHDE
jgi:hypothetical protein